MYGSKTIHNLIFLDASDVYFYLSPQQQLCYKEALSNIFCGKLMCGFKPTCENQNRGGTSSVGQHFVGRQGKMTLVDRPTQLICISDIYLSTDKYKRHSRAIC